MLVSHIRSWEAERGDRAGTLLIFTQYVNELPLKPVCCLLILLVSLLNRGDSQPPPDVTTPAPVESLATHSTPCVRKLQKGTCSTCTFELQTTAQLPVAMQTGWPGGTLPREAGSAELLNVKALGPALHTAERRGQSPSKLRC